jgi:putative transposon-encoded protein
MAKNFQYTKEEVTSEVKKFGGGGAYVSVPSSWIGGRVKVTLLRTNTINIDWDKEGIKNKKPPNKAR